MAVIADDWQLRQQPLVQPLGRSHRTGTKIFSTPGGRTGHPVGPALKPEQRRVNPPRTEHRAENISRRLDLIPPALVATKVNFPSVAAKHGGRTLPAIRQPRQQPESDRIHRVRRFRQQAQSRVRQAAQLAQRRQHDRAIPACRLIRPVLSSDEREHPPRQGFLDLKREQAHPRSLPGIAAQASLSGELGRSSHDQTLYPEHLAVRGESGDSRSRR